jgi:hypothetical protein
MTLPSRENLKAKLTKEVKNSHHSHRLENLKSSLKLSYQSVKKGNKRSNLNNKRQYNRKAKPRSFDIGDLVYLYNPERTPGSCRTFHKLWTGPFNCTDCQQYLTGYRPSSCRVRIFGKSARMSEFTCVALCA